MKNPGRMENVTRQLVATLLSLSMVFLFASTSQAAINCTQCHGDGSTSSLPIDAVSGTYRNITTGAVKGNHGTHSGAVTIGQPCARCHGAAAASYTSNHAILKHYSIQISASMNYNKGAGAVTAFPQTATPTLGTCSTVNCHFETVTPTWGQAVTWTSQKGASSDASSTCTQCHLGAALASGKHTKHISSYNNDLTSCAKCHPDYYTPAGAPAFSHATSNSGSIKMTFATGSLRTASTFLPGAATNSAATCSTTYCHKGASVTPAWNGAATTCVSCHDATSTGLSTVHNRHYNSTTPPTAINATNANTATGYVYGCANCHPSANHVQGSANPSVQDANVLTASAKITTYTPGGGTFTDAKGYSYTTNATCTSVCHTRTGLIADGPIVTANWSGSFTGSCAVCHKASGEAYATMVGNGANGLSAKHNLHMANDRYGLNTTNYTCATCHAGTATDNTTIAGATGRDQHPNANRDVAMTAFASGGTVTIGGTQGSQTCANTYCHSNGTIAAGTHTAINWTTGSVPGDCSGCHGGNSTASAATRIRTVVHAQHLYSTGRMGKTIGCADCHKATVSSDSAIASYTNHVDKNVNIKFDNVINKDSDAPTYVSGTSTITANGAVKAAGAAGYTCANLYCHSVGNLGSSSNLVNGGAGVKYKNIAWNAAAIDCGGCHGSGGNSSHPAYTSGLAGYSTANSHVKHVVSSSLGCDYCHYNTVTQTGITPNQVRLNNFSGHLNRKADIRFKLNAGKTGTYTPGNAGATTKTCSNTYCHGTGPSTAWGGTTTCASCHDASNNGGLSTRHDNHYATTNIAGVLAGGTDAHTASAYVYACLNCHPTAAHTTGPADTNAPLQDANVTGTKISGYVKGGSSTTDAKGYNYTQGTCTTVCHTRDGVSAAPVVTAVWSGAVTGGCAVCHKAGGESYATMVANVTNPLSVVHNKHVANDRYGLNTANYTCAACHAGTATNNTTINGASGRTLHPNANREVSMTPFASGGTVTIGGTQGNQSCANTYCHSNGTIAAGTHTAINWTGGTLAANCAGCHGGNSVAGTSAIKTYVHAQHLYSTARMGKTVHCKDCHSATITNADDATVTSYTKHVDKNVNVKFDNVINRDGDLPTYNAIATTGASDAAKTPGTAGYTCNNLYCHSIGNLSDATGTGTVVTAGAASFRSVDWNGGALGCSGCHGDLGTKSHPTYTTGAVGSTTANSHVAHVESSGYSCDFCHNTTTTDTAIPPKTLLPAGNHLDRIENVSFKLNGGMTGTYNATVGQKNCSNTYCHGVSASVGWGGSTNCASCHVASVVSSIPTNYWNMSSAHRQHIESATLPNKFLNYSGNISSATNYRFACYVCHGSNVNGTAVHSGGPVNASTQAAQVFFTYTATGRVGVYTPGSAISSESSFKYSDGTCSNIYCHSDGNGGGPKKSSFTWKSQNNTLRCNGCHASQDWKLSSAQPAYSSIRTQAHARHIRGDINTELNVGNGIDCYRCHGATVTAAFNSYSTVGANVLNKKRHVNKMRDYSGVTTNPNGGAAVSSGQFNPASHTCSNVYCHSNSKIGTTSVKYTSPEAWNSGASLRKCNYCHGRQNHAPTVNPDTNNAFSLFSSTGVPNYLSGAGGATDANSHRQHIAVMGTTDYSNTNVCYSCHAQTLDSTTGRSANAAKFRAYSSRHTSGAYNVKIKSGYGGNYTGTVGTKTCAANTCHGNTASAVSPKWGANNDGNASCTKCHGKPTVQASYSTTRALQAAPGYGQAGLGLSRVDPSLTFTNGVSTDPKVGAHDAHLRAVNQYTGRKVLCTDCHTVPSNLATDGSNGHLNGGGADMTWSSLAQNIGTTAATNTLVGALSPAYSSGTGQCSANYCHGGKLRDGSNTAPIWNQTAYLGSYAKSTANCGKCHGAPPTTNPGYAHSGEAASWAINPATTTCAGCHGHEGNGPTHIDGNLSAGGSTCDSCHDYDTVSATLTNGVWSNGTWGKNDKSGANQTGQGWGAHAKHINAIKTRLGIVTALNTATTYGVGHAREVCGTCHTNVEAGNHNTGDLTVRTINFGDGAYTLGATGTTLRFGANVPTFNGANNTSSAAAPKSCSNISCHYFTSPNWSNYP